MSAQTGDGLTSRVNELHADPPKHVVEISDNDGERSYWECDCGSSGSAPSCNVDFAAEKHIPHGEPRSYRTRGTE